MKKGGGKQKGNAYERYISRIFDAWWEEEPHTFWRTTNSGAWGPWEVGDISPRAKRDRFIWFPFVVECKFHRNIDVLELLESSRKGRLLQKWWDQISEAQTEAVGYGRNPMECLRLLVMKRNRSQDYVAYRPEELAHIATITTGIIINVKDLHLQIVPYSDFVKTFSKKIICDTYKKGYKNADSEDK